MSWVVVSELVMVLLTMSISFQECKMEGFIVGGNFAKIRKYPHSAFLRISCINESDWICGASILNQYLLLTAAHCIDNCNNIVVTAIVGSENRYKGLKVGVRNMTLHESYDPVVSRNDIGMILLEEPLVFSRIVSRVSLLRKPPMNKVAFTAGWGRIDDVKGIGTEVLMYANQTVISRKDCYKFLGWIPRGCICGMNTNKNTYVAGGDSGSALVVDGYIQIGIVSHKYPSITKRVIVYTDVAYFYDWIVQTAHDLYCNIE